MRLQTFVFETKGVKGFIDRTSKGSYVSFVEINPYVYAA